MNARSLFTLLLFFIPLFAFGQTDTYLYSGKVQDAKGQPVEYATVAAYQGTNLVKGASTSEGGKFSLDLAAGQYLLKITALGYKALEERIRVQAQPVEKAFRLEEDAKELAAVVVDARKPLFTREVGKLILNAERLSVLADNALELLKRTPGVVVSQDDAVSMVGKGALYVMEDGRDLPLEGDALANYLRGLQSQDVEAIEVITTPPAKYTASGPAGVINIKLKKRISDYLGGTLMLSHSMVKRTSQEMPSFSLKYKKGIFSLGLSGDLTYGDILLRENRTLLSYKDGRPGWERHTLKKGRELGGYLGLTFGIDLSESLSLGGNIRYRRDKDQAKQEIQLKSNDVSSEGLAELPDRYSFLGTALYATKGFRSGGSLEATLQYYRKEARLESRYLERGMKLYDDHSQHQTDSYVGKLDLELPIQKSILSLGASLNYTQADNRKSYAGRLAVPDQKDHFIYKELVWGLYSDILLPLSERFQLKAGLRAEMTSVKGLSELKGENKKNYLDLFPSLFAQWSIAEGHALQLGLSNRLWRPNFTELNPFEYTPTPNEVQRGNPELRPTKIYTAELGYTYRDFLTIGLQYEHRVGQTDELKTIDPVTNVLYNQSINAMDADLLLLYAYYNKLLTSWLEAQVSLVGYYVYNVNKAHTPPHKGQDLNLNLQARLTAYLDQAHRLAIETDGRWATVEFDGARKSYQNKFINLGVRYTMLNGRLTAKASVQNLLSSHWRFAYYRPEYVHDSKSYHHPYWRLSLSYNFGGRIQAKNYQFDDISNRL